MTQSNDPLFQLMERIECQECLDTNISITLFDHSACANCTGPQRRWSNPAYQLQQCVTLRTEKRLPVEKQALLLARVLTHFTSDAPLLLQQIADYWRIDLRTAKGAIATLRGDWLLPIGSHRHQPHGAYWIRTAEEFISWSRAYRSQAITSLATVYKLQRQHFPALYGQGDLAFVSQISDELKEAM